MPRSVNTPFRLGGESLMVCPRGGGGGGLRSPVSFPLFCVTTGVFQSLTSLTGRGLDGTHTKTPSSSGHDSLCLCFLTGTIYAAAGIPCHLSSMTQARVIRSLENCPIQGSGTSETPLRARKSVVYLGLLTDDCGVRGGVAPEQRRDFMSPHYPRETAM